MIKRITAGVILSVFWVSANADGPISGQGDWETTLELRAGGQAYYDTVQNITWVADASLAKTLAKRFQNAEITGAMLWPDWQIWINSLNYLGVGAWRLPTTVQPDGGCQNQSSTGDWGSNCKLGEMGHLYYITLGNSANPAVTNTGPFFNIRLGSYWTGTVYEDNADQAWHFNFNNGAQNRGTKENANLWGWIVRDGDIGTVPFNDADGDQRADDVDNCLTLANNSGAGAQCDSDNDGFGNRCDGDISFPVGVGVTNSQDYVIFRGQVGQPSVAPTYNKADINCNGSVNAQDYVLFRGLLGHPPGSSGYLCAGVSVSFDCPTLTY